VDRGALVGVPVGVDVPPPPQVAPFVHSSPVLGTLLVQGSLFCVQ
jgi:hypothetical protein